MASDDNSSEELPVVELSEPCRHLRSKGMYVYSDGRSGDSHGDYDNTIYWCLKTHKGFGPDEEFVAGEDCRNAARSCYEPM